MSKDSLPHSPPSSWTLAIPGILESVLENLTNEDLFVCRLVCQSWAKEAGRIIGKQLEKEVSGLRRLEILRKIQMCSDISIPLKKLRVEIPFSFKNIRYSSLSYSTVTSLELTCSPSLVLHFLVHIFPNLESLRLYVDYPVYELVVSSAAVCENRMLPRLRNLELYECLDRRVWISLVYKLLERAKKLESIKVNPRSTVATLFVKVYSSNLKSITVSSNISGTFFAALNNHPITFPLETIDLADIDNATVSKSDIKLLLTRFSSTLSKLLLGFRGIFEMNFPLGVPLKKLHTLKIDNFRGSMEWRNLPQLKKMFLQSGSIEGIASSISSTQAHCQLEALDINGTDDDDDSFIIFFRDIAECLGPQLKSLELYDLSWESLLPVIFTSLTQLNRLSLEGFYEFRDMTDKNLCGKDSLPFRPPRGKTLGVPLNEAYQRLIASAEKSNLARGPNITNLKDLQFLSIYGSFSEVAVLHGLVQCEKLRELYLHFPDVGTTRDSIVHLLVNAGLEHLTTVKLNGELINHLSFAPKTPRVINRRQCYR